MQKRFEVENNSGRSIELIFEPIPEHYLIPPQKTVEVCFEEPPETIVDIAFWNDKIIIFGCPWGPPWDEGVTVLLDGKKMEEETL